MYKTTVRPAMYFVDQKLYAKHIQDGERKTSGKIENVALGTETNIFTKMERWKE